MRPLMFWRQVPRSPDPPDPNGPPAPTPAPTPPAPTPPTPPAPPEPDPGTINLTSAQLKERLDRSHAARLREAGLGSDAELQELIARDKKRKEDEEAARLASLSREQVLTEQKTKAEAEAAESKALLARATFERHVTGVCARMGVKNTDYAMFDVERAAEALPDGQELDVEGYLKERMEKSPEARAALGMAPDQVVPVPVTTTPGGAPPVPPAPGAPGAPKDAFGMSTAEWQQRQAALGLG